MKPFRSLVAMVTRRTIL